MDCAKKLPKTKEDSIGNNQHGPKSTRAHTRDPLIASHRLFSTSYQLGRHPKTKQSDHTYLIKGPCSVFGPLAHQLGMNSLAQVPRRRLFLKLRFRTSRRQFPTIGFELQKEKRKSELFISELDYCKTTLLTSPAANSTSFLFLHLFFVFFRLSLAPVDQGDF